MGGLLSLVIFALDIWVIVDCIKSSRDSNNKILWVLLIIFLPLVGLILYLTLGKNKA